ncbi:hypothetical protein [Streptomyces specialis]|uniref:hypothetical protein n=1 Tax=Streptomyces specialis TaxID=498367 RepID=UPI00073E6F2D|nr:hypothetical protein [Streptomyces specialis]
MSTPPTPAPPQDVLAELKNAGYEPAGPFPGASRPWNVRCLDPACGAPRRVVLSPIRAGKRRCRHRARPPRPPVTHDQAVKELKAAGFRHLEPYPGNVTVLWHIVCARPGCPGGERNIPLTEIRRGTRCAHRPKPRPRVTPQAAAEEMRRAGLEPCDPYPGTVTAAWRSRCTQPGCRRRRLTSLAAVRHGVRCGHQHPDQWTA